MTAMMELGLLHKYLINLFFSGTLMCRDTIEAQPYDENAGHLGLNIQSSPYKYNI